MQSASDISLDEAAQAIREGALSPADLLEACLARIAEVEPIVKAFAAIDSERATRDARSLTAELREHGPRGPLHGIPMGVKDMVDVDGMPTRAGSHALDNEPLPADSPVVKRLRDAGALILGKTTTHEFASGITTPPTRNPWDPSRIPGGSSGGSGAAVAAGECLAALGTDSGGSIRVPSAFCGVSGLRPRLETVPPEGIIPLSWTHDTCGPIARGALDLALVWRVMADEPAVRTDLPISEMTVGIPDSLQSVLEVESGVEEKTAAAAKVLESQGARLTSVDLPPFNEWDAPRKAVVVSDMLALHRESGWFPQRASQYGDDTAAFLRGGERITGADLAVAHRTLRALRRRFMGMFDVVDVLVIPTTIRSAPRWKEAERTTPLAEQPKDSTFADARPLVPDVLRATGPIGWCGLVSVSVPSGFSSEGMPIGVQIVTRDESTALSAAAHYQSVTDFHRARPPIDQLATIQGSSASTTASRLPPSHRTEDQSQPGIPHPHRG